MRDDQETEEKGSINFVLVMAEQTFYIGNCMQIQVWDEAE